MLAVPRGLLQVTSSLGRFKKRLREYSYIIRQDDPIGYWQLNLDLNTTTAVDDSRITEDAIFVDGSPTWSLSPLILQGTSISVDGNHAETGDVYGVFDTISFEAWVQRADWAQSTKQIFFAFRNASDNSQSVQLGFENGQIVHWRSGNNQVLSYDISSSSANTAHYIVVTQQRQDASTVNLVMYVDNNQVDSVTGDFEDFQGPVYIGGADGSILNDYDNAWDWTERLDQVALYDKVLTNEQIATHYNAGAFGITIGGNSNPTFTDSATVNTTLNDGLYEEVVTEQQTNDDSATVNTTLNNGLYEEVIAIRQTNDDSANISTTLNSGLYQAVIITGNTDDDSVDVSTTLNDGLYEEVVTEQQTNNDNIDINTTLVGGIYEQV